MEENQVLFQVDLVIMFSSALLAFFGNIFIIVTFARDKKLQSTTTVPLVSLACTDVLLVLYVAIYIPLQLTYGQFVEYSMHGMNQTEMNGKISLEDDILLVRYTTHLLSS